MLYLIIKKDKKNEVESSNLTFLSTTLELFVFVVFLPNLLMLSSNFLYFFKYNRILHILLKLRYKWELFPRKEHNI